MLECVAELVSVNFSSPAWDCESRFTGRKFSHHLKAVALDKNYSKIEHTSYQRRV